MRYYFYAITGATGNMYLDEAETIRKQRCQVTQETTTLSGSSAQKMTQRQRQRQTVSILTGQKDDKGEEEGG